MLRAARSGPSAGKKRPPQDDNQTSYGDCSERNGEAQVTLANFSTRSCTWKGTSGARGRNGGATERAPNPGPKLLKKTRSPQTRNRISHRLAPEYPASHREAQSCVTQMHEPH